LKGLAGEQSALAAVPCQLVFKTFFKINQILLQVAKKFGPTQNLLLEVNMFCDRNFGPLATLPTRL
jgi:hypothetical protein